MTALLPLTESDATRLCVQDLVTEFDKAVGDEDSGFERKGNNAQGDDRITMKTYLKFCTVNANPFNYEAMRKADFPEGIIGGCMLKLLCTSPPIFIPAH